MPSLTPRLGTWNKGQIVLMKKGEYTVGARDAKSGIFGNKGIADTVLRISKKGIRIRGEEGAVLRGMLLLEASAIMPLRAMLQPDFGCYHSHRQPRQLRSFLPLLRTCDDFQETSLGGMLTLMATSRHWQIYLAA